MKIFLSHSTKDKDFVTQLAANLRNAGYEPWACEVDIASFENFVSKIEDGLNTSDLTILVWSPSAANSAWTEQEWTSALARQIEEARIRLGVVLLQTHPLPQLLRHLNFIDARTDQRAAIQAVLAWVDLRRNASRLSGQTQLVRLDGYRPAGFVGRQTYLARLRTALIDEPSTFLLYGEPGKGKTAIALQFAWNSQKAFDSVVFQICGDRDADEIGGELAAKLGLNVQTLMPAKQREAAKDWLKVRQSLLVLDDVRRHDLEDLIPGAPVSVLCTSRLKTVPWVAPDHALEVEQFSETEAESVFTFYLGPEDTKMHRDALMMFAKQVEWLPLAISVGADLLRNTSAPLGKAAVTLKLESLTAEGKRRDVPELLEEAIDARPEPQRRFLLACSLCASVGFWKPLPAAIAGLNENDAQLACDSLVTSSLLRCIDRDGERFQLQALLREQLQKSLSSMGAHPDATEPCGSDPRPELALGEKHASFIEKLFREDETGWEARLKCFPEIIPAMQYLWHSGERQRMAALSRRLPPFAIRTGLFVSLMRIVDHQILLWKEQGGRESKEALRELFRDGGICLRALGDLERAFEFQKLAESLCLELDDKEGLQSSYGSQAIILQMWGQSELAMALFKKQEQICEDSNMLRALQTCWLNQAGVLRSWNRLDEAMQLYKKQERVCSENSDNEGLRQSLVNQAGVLREQGKFDESLSLLQREEPVCKKLNLNTVLGYLYWNWGLTAIKVNDLFTARDKLLAALRIFAACHMAIELRSTANESAEVARLLCRDAVPFMQRDQFQPARDRLEAAVDILKGLNLTKDRDVVADQLADVIAAQARAAAEARKIRRDQGFGPSGAGPVD